MAEKMGKIGHFESPLAGPLPPSRMGPAYAPFCPFWPLLPLGLGPFEVSPDLLVRVLVELVANYWSWPGGGGGGVQPRNPRTS